MRAMVYLRFLSKKDVELNLLNTRNKMMKHCTSKKYDILVWLNMVGNSPYAIDHGQEKIMEIAQKGYIDLLVLQDFQALSSSMQEAAQMIRQLKQCGVRVECMRYDLLGYTLHRALENESLTAICTSESNGCTGNFMTSCRKVCED